MAEPRTRAEALAQALAWGSTRSHLNAMMGFETYMPAATEGDFAQPDRQQEDG